MVSIITQQKKPPAFFKKRACNFVVKRLEHTCEICKIFKIPIFKNIYKGLLLTRQQLYITLKFLWFYQMFLRRYTFTYFSNNAF